jgi:hypothetical protein
MSRFVSLLVALVLVVSLSGAAPAQAQEKTRSRPARLASLNFTVGLPTGAFSDNVENPGFGGNLFLGTQLGRSPAVLGLDLGFLIYGRNTSTVPFSTTVPIRVELVTTNSILQPHAVLRFQPQQGTVRPYIEGLGGFKYLSTETKVRDDDLQDNRDIASETNFEDLAWSGGGGAGFDVVVYRSEERDGQGWKLRHVSLHLGAQYLFGQEAEYVADAEIQDENGNNVIDTSELDIRRSATSIVTLKFGASVFF